MAHKIKTSADQPSREAVETAVQALRDGRIVALPTETVYGLAVRADLPEAVENLKSLKGRDASKAFARLIGDHRDLPAALPRLAQTAIRQFWPGPLTVVLNVSADGKTCVEGRETGDNLCGYRLPALEVARRIARELKHPIYLTSANKSGQPECNDGDAVARLFDDTVAVIIDTGPTLLQEASSVVYFGQDTWKVLREGALTRRELRKKLTHQILFVCTGNSCRSPMAEALFRVDLARDLGVGEDELARLGISVGSCGIAASEGEPAADHAVTVAEEAGSESLSRHKSRQATPEVLESATSIFALSHSHLRWIRENAPEVAGRTWLLDPQGVSDPIGGSLEQYRQCAQQIRKALAPIRQKLISDGQFAPA